MQAIILAGGLGSRLRPLTLIRPKCLLPILDKPLIEHVMESFPDSIEETFLTLSDAYEIPERFLTERFPGMEIRIAKEREPLGTGGAVKILEDKIKGDFLVVNGDVLSSLDLSALLKFHKKKMKKKGLGTISLFSVDEPERYGVVEIDNEGRIVMFEEKPEKPFSNLINAGTYVLGRDIFDHIPDQTPASIERDVFTQKAKEMFGYEFDGYWVDCGTPESYLATNRILLDEQGSFMEGEIEGVDVRDKVYLNQCRIRGGKIGPNVVVGEGATINNGAISNSIIFKHAKVDSYATIENSIIGENCRIGINCYIDRCILGDGIDLPSDRKITNQRIPKSW